MSFNTNKYLLLLLLFISINSAEIKFKNPNSTNETHLNDTDTNHTIKERPKVVFDKNKPLNMTVDEMDTLMLCSTLVQDTVRKEQTKIEEIAKKLNLTRSDSVYEKIGTDIFEQCVNKIDIAVVNKYIKNLTYFNNFNWESKFDELVKIDYSKYNNSTDLIFTYTQRWLMYKYQKADELFRQRRADNREFVENENRKLKIGQFDLDRIPGFVKALVFLGIFGLFFGGLFYLLKSMEKKPKEKKDRKKKKTQ